MKIFKKKEHSLLVKNFGIRNTLYLACTIMVFFDLKNPDEPLTEQELWKTVPDQLGPSGILDMGMPKPRGEVVITGSCMTPQGTERVASEVSFRVGNLKKSLDVFGDRFWNDEGGVMKLMSDPEPFTEIPITYDYAFGGEGFEKNPLGKGIQSLTARDGRTHIPLPNIEHPHHLIGSPTDRPEPASFGPLDLMWPQRFKKQGTYDEKWQRERWPYFPDDMNYEFFNTAPEDQFIIGYFAGDETIELINMHPDIQVISSYLPRLRVRCFVTKKKDLKAGGDDNEIFQEVTTRIDTVWLFPKILRGVVLYRGSMEVQDDEFADIVRIFLASEKMYDEPRSIEHYLDEQKKALNLTVPIDQAPLEKAQKKIGKALRRIKNIPKEIEAAKFKAMGKAPRMPAPTPAEVKARSAGMVGKNMALIAGVEDLAKSMHEKYGHLVKIDLDKFDVLRSKLKRAEKQIGQDMDDIEEVSKNAEASKKNISALLNQAGDPEQLKKAGIDPDNPFPEDSVNPWHDHGFPFVVRCRKNLEADRKAQDMLCELGFEKRTVRRVWLGINPEDETRDPKDWGLEPGSDDQGQPKPFVLPRGLVMPSFNEAVLNRILIRPGDYSGGDRDVVIEGSDMNPRFLPAAGLSGLPGLPARENAPCIQVTDELQALYLEQEVGDFCSVIALKTPGEKPDAETAKAVEAASTFLVVIFQEKFSEDEWGSWLKAYPNAIKLTLPRGNTVFEARRQGVDIRNWVMEVLPQKYMQENQAEPSLPKQGKPPDKSAIVMPPIPRIDIKGMITGLIGEIKAFHQPKFDALQSRQKTVEDQARETLKTEGRDMSALKAATGDRERRSFAEFGEERAASIASKREQMRAEGQLTPEMETKMNEAEDQARKMGRESEQRYQDGMAKIEAGEQEAVKKKAKAKAGEPPDKAKEKLLAAGVDPDNVTKLSREAVVERYEKGETFAGAILSGVDLSKLDLHGIDLRGTTCKKTNFSETNLDGADLSQSVAMEADFTKASLKNVVLEKGLFTGAVFNNTDLYAANLHQALMKKADMTGANLDGARLDRVILQKAQLSGASLKGVSATMSVFSGADASEADFSKSKLNKCLFKGAVLDRADFSGAAINSTMFMGVKGEGVRFEGANMDKGRMGGNASLPGANFRNVSMKYGCFRDSDLSGADFRGSTFDQSILENCNLKKADFSRIPAKKCRFNKSNLENANLSGINLFMGSLRKARIVNTDLSGSNLFAVDFYKAVVGKTNFDGANLKMSQLHNRVDFIE